VNAFRWCTLLALTLLLTACGDPPRTAGVVVPDPQKLRVGVPVRVMQTKVGVVTALKRQKNGTLVVMRIDDPAVPLRATDAARVTTPLAGPSAIEIVLGPPTGPPLAKGQLLQADKAVRQSTETLGVFEEKIDMIEKAYAVPEDLK
jgi:ABC-type transporter Mla subunit MlaD